MKVRCSSVVVLALACVLTQAVVLAEPMGTAFTYQGRVEDGSGPVTDSCDFEFSLWDAASGGIVVGDSPQSALGVSLEDGLFTVTLEFGPDAINGEARWLEMAVCCPSTCTPVVLTPRQEMTPAPHALALPGLWTEQNATSPNVVGGHASNMIETGNHGATIGGGGAAGFANRVLDYHGTVGGGRGNQAGSDDGNPNNGRESTVGGGFNNTASNGASTVSGGRDNTASGVHAAVGGGSGNAATGDNATVSGGETNTAAGHSGVVAGGRNNTASGTRASVGGGEANSATLDHATIAGGMSNLASGIRSTVGGGESNTASGDTSTVAGGHGNVASGQVSTVCGGEDNEVSGHGGTIAGGGGYASGSYLCDYPYFYICGICAGGENEGAACTSDLSCFGGTCEPDSGVCPGGTACDFREELSCDGGTDDGASCGRCTGNGAFCAFDMNCGPNGPCVPYQEDCASPGICRPRTRSNRVTGHFGTIAGGIGNSAGSGSSATVGGGYTNHASAFAATVAGGSGNYATGDNSTVGGGLSNKAGYYGATASGSYSTVPGGYANIAGGDYSFAAGHRATVRDTDAAGVFPGDQGTFVWSDSTGGFESTGRDQFLIDADGGVGIGTNSPSEQLDVAGNIHASGTITTGSSITIDGAAGSENINSTGDLDLQTGGMSRVFLDGITGNVGIGTTNPSAVYRLRVVNSDAGGTGTRNEAPFIGVSGKATLVSGMSFGVYGESDSTSGRGVYGSAEASTGVNYGVRGRTSSSSGYAGYFEGGRNYFQGYVGIGDAAPDVALDVVGDINYTGVITDVSDERLKENVTPVRDALQKVRQLRGVYFNMKDTPDQRDVGLIAQNVQAALPEAVRIVDPNTGHLGVSYTSLIALLVEAIKQQDKETTELRSRIEALENARTWSIARAGVPLALLGLVGWLTLGRSRKEGVR